MYCCICCEDKTTTQTVQFRYGTELETHPVCPECLTINVENCAGCNESIWVAAVGVHGADDTYVCACCWNTGRYYECTHCGLPINNRRDSGWLMRNDRRLCGSCFDHCGYTLCEPCDYVVPDDDWDGDEDRCVTCARGSVGAVIKEWNFDPMKVLKFMGTPPGDLFSGVELEIDTQMVPGDRNDVAAVCLKRLGNDFAIAKRDGSIQGFEVVSAPASMAVHYERWPKLFDKVPRGLRSWDGDNCGMHVHMSRNALTPLTIQKMKYFLSHPGNNSFITLIAGRSSNRYCQKQGIKPEIYNRSDRYVALNLLNAKTVEYRIFRGTLKKGTFFKNLEFCYALPLFCLNRRVPTDVQNTRQEGVIDSQYTGAAFCLWIAERAKQYPYLHAFLVAKGHITDSVTPPQYARVASINTTASYEAA